MPEAKQLTPRQLDQRHRILEATRQMLVEDGYDGLQMRSLAERANVSLMTIYNRFGNKDDLILLALQEMLAELGERARASGKRGIEFTLHNAEIIAQQILQTPEYAKAMALMLFNGQPDSPIVETLLLSNVSQAHAQLEEMQDMGEIGDDINLDLLARAMAVAGWSTILLWMKGVIGAREFKKQYRLAPLLVLAPAMTRDTRPRYADDLR